VHTGAAAGFAMFWLAGAAYSGVNQDSVADAVCVMFNGSVVLLTTRADDSVGRVRLLDALPLEELSTSVVATGDVDGSVHVLGTFALHVHCLCTACALPVHCLCTACAACALPARCL
jgi:hypothetical protein